MKTITRARAASVLVLLVIASLTASPTASAGWGHWHHRWMDDPSVGYTVPIQAVYQFPAAVGYQPGSYLPFAAPNPVPGLLGGRPYLYHQ
jgi:hypothetical protein